MDVSSRDLRNHTRTVLDRVQRGESVQITVNNRPVAQLVPTADRPSWISGAAMAGVLRRAPADGHLMDDLAPLREQTVQPR